jgi:hypothetical protein
MKKRSHLKLSAEQRPARRLTPTAEPAASAHSYKYRLFYGRRGERIICYDNERPKGDHRHRDGREESYEFKDVETLVRDFLADVEERRSHEEANNTNTQRHQGCPKGDG